MRDEGIMSGSYNRWRGVEGGQLAGSYYIGEGRGGSPGWLSGRTGGGLACVEGREMAVSGREMVVR